ncbi:hypothetical protein [Mediterraneibacter gnavus]|uniref:Uncharacterized protein n=1 Tax=Mediterraneibacter gnavus TaxID=33038 RepID=A0A2N5PWP8_MEDGN|nr:hypothetical protein [Mediterraneibacter gnavus]PLT82079.1 hypothetical protein CDL20_13965 [Mediterraneibacter gnavus]
MGLRSFFRSVGNWVKEKVGNAVDWVRDKLSGKRYDESDVADHVDVDAVLAEFRKSINDDIVEAEKKCMRDISSLFSDLIERTQEKFPDLVDIIKTEQDKAEKELNGTIMRYVKEHLSKNDPKFLKVLKMNPGSAKSDALKLATEQALENAEKAFNSRLKKYAEDILREFTSRLNSRISDQEGRMSQRIGELEILQAEAESGQIDVDALKDSSSPVMESAQCIIRMLEMEM